MSYGKPKRWSLGDEVEKPSKPSKRARPEDERPGKNSGDKPVVTFPSAGAFESTLAVDKSTLKHFKQFGIDLLKTWGAGVVSGFGNYTALGSGAPLEAIVRVTNRPSLLVTNGVFADPAEAKWRVALNANRQHILQALRAVGRVECENPDVPVPFLGTAWMVTDKLAITNTHVARMLLDFDGTSGSRAFPKNLGSNKQSGKPFRAFVNFDAQHLTTGESRVAIKRVVWAANNWEKITNYEPDMALLELDDSSPLPAPIPLADKPLRVGSQVVVIGYPAKDSRNPLDEMENYFKNIYNVKRIAPGDLTEYVDESHLKHDATTLGGNSGSVVLDMYTGSAVGLHYGGLVHEYNIAVTGAKIRQVLTSVLAGVNVELPEADSASIYVETEAVGRAPSDLGDRKGYNKKFLGRELPVPLPTPKEKDAPVLKYQHHSVVMNKARRLAWVAASNIDGELSKQIKRKNTKWWTDPRLDDKFQVGNDFYTGTSYDRGHLSRREDTAWGTTVETANVGQLDTFCYSNSAPQWWAFNQQTWLGLENKVLESVRTCVIHS
eukprot:TRINITY_DN321_c2_g1_i2.p1 TRINITY_DN321_c2_g1~~TRINITY_DN321_c2_g1_i2.p1  ORF type:complete len:549 (+),score=217.15 TRINITY_DN321_c2_g1_i2:144-1790(+)